MREGIAEALKIVLIMAGVALTVAGQIHYNEGDKITGIFLAAAGAGLLALMMIR